jgi:LPXTG-motif cell wall-anchored protein
MRALKSDRIVKSVVLLLITTLMLLYTPVVSFAAVGDFSLNFVAAAPYSYDHETGGGAYDDGTIGKNADIVNSLEGSDFAKGDIVTFLVKVTVADTIQAETDAPQTIVIDLEFDADSTGQSGMAFSDIVRVEVNDGTIEDLIAGEDNTDSGNVGDGGSSATLISENLTGLFDGGTLFGSIEVDDLERGESVIVRVDVRLNYKNSTSPTGNLQSALANAWLVEINGEPVSTIGRISTGQQTITLKNVDKIYSPSIDVEKYVSVDGGSTWEDADSAPGPILLTGTDPEYKYVITNTGDIGLTDLTLTDDVLGTITLSGTTLAAGDTMTAYDTGTWGEGLRTNIATVTGYYEEMDYSDTDPANYTGADPDIQVVKYVWDGDSWEDANSAPGPTLLSGTTPQFKYVITNLNGVTLTDVTLTDDILGSITLPKTTLSSSESMNATASGTWGEGLQTNIASVSAKYGTSTYTDTDPANYTGADPDIQVVKSVWDGDSWEDANTAPGPTLLIGTTPQFKYVITNLNGVTLTDVTLADDILGTITLPKSTLTSGEVITVEASGTWGEGLQTNIASVSAKYGTSTFTDTDPANYSGADPDIEVVKSVWDGDSWEDANTAPGPTLLIGTTPQFKYVITNLNGVTLTDVTLADDVLGSITLPKSTLTSGEVMTVEASGTWGEGLQTNIASVSAKYGTSTYTDTDPANYTGADPDIMVVKSIWDGDSWEDANSAPGPSLLTGTTPLFQYVITNLNGVTLTDVTLTDNILGAITLPKSTLAYGESMTVEATGAWALGLQTNIATVSGSYRGIIYTDTDPASYTGTVPGEDNDPNVVLLKNVDKYSAPTDTPFLYTITIRNIGDTPFTITKLTDSQLDPLPAQLQELIGMKLKVGDSVTRTYELSYAAAGTYPNTAFVEVIDIHNERAIDTDYESVNVIEVEGEIVVFGAEMPQTGDKGIDWLAMGALILIAAGCLLFLKSGKKSAANE